MHHRGHSGSLLDIIFRDGTEISGLLLQVLKLRFVDHVSLQVLSLEIPAADDINLLEWVTENCFEVSQLDRALEAFRLWKPLLDNTLASSALEGVLIATPALPQNLLEGTSQESMKTEAFHVNTIYTKPAVAKLAVQTFRELVEQEINNVEYQQTASSGILWVDAGAGSGALLQSLPQDSSLGVDLHPQHSSVHARDFFQVSTQWLQETAPKPFESICIISNPPFVEGTRGDYSIIGKFLKHATFQLKASFMGLIVPAKFAHAWKSFGLPIRLAYRMHLPKDSFYDPSTAESKHLQCYLLVFDLQPKQPTTLSGNQSPFRTRIHTTNLMTIAFTAVVQGLGRAGVPLGSSKHKNSIPLKAKLSKSLELFVELNPKRPLSIANSMSSRVQNHSLGWMSKSVKPPVALAMHQLSSGTPGDNQPTTASVVVDLMCGEGTLEYESMEHNDSPASTFRIVGDKSPEAIEQVAARCHDQELLIDFIVWDAQNLPLRKGIADVVLGDLPFAGSNKKKHQTPVAAATSSGTSDVSCSYPKVLASLVRVLTPSVGRTVLVSADSKALTHGTWKFAGYLKELWQTKLNIGGLAGRMLVLGRKDASWKDINLFVEEGGVDRSSVILTRARAVCGQFYLNDLLELQQDTTSNGGTISLNLLSQVQLREEYCHVDQSLSQCYRFHFDPIVTNAQAKVLEKAIRLDLEKNPVIGTRMFYNREVARI
ncbi:THUMP domain containing 3 [Seminavis robusta]|uniref:THUMP domain containing 3 n=1 Tax=Seminavis robusta TaxID=568900 RepID=A0A9N8HUL1_9STRA|nr:THUMP domain containing 3 [Seminavis robusta]|eukprot:Sro1769_g296410.1 THUMP domain containing 3 (712) ;mRNA; f:2087-4280